MTSNYFRPKKIVSSINFHAQNNTLVVFHYRILIGLQTISWIVKREGCVTVTLNLVARATFDIKLAFTTGPQIKRVDKSASMC